MAVRHRFWEVTTPMYEDFQPKYERKEEAAENIILVHLPGFVKEQIKITYVNSSRTVKVHGERQLVDDRSYWSRFYQSFPVPENCDIDKIHGKFQHGILTITMPKKIISQVLGPAEEAKTAKKAQILPKSTAEPKPQKVQEEIPPTPASTSGVEKQREEKIAQPQSLYSTAAPEPKVEKDMEDIPPIAASTAIDERQRVVKTDQSPSPPKATTEPKSQKGPDLAPPKATSTTDTRKVMDKTSVESSAEKVDQKSIKKKYILLEGNGKAKETKDSEKFMEIKMIKGKESGEKSTDSVMADSPAPNISQTGKEKKRSGGKEKKPKEDFNAEKGTGIKFLKDSDKLRVNNLAKRLNEDERQMLVNVGAAALVLVALGAYVYSYASSGKSEN